MDRLTELFERLLGLVPGAIILGILIIVGVYVVRKIRAETIQKDSSDTQMLIKLQEMRARGELDETEFRTIKTQLVERMRDGASSGKEKR